MTADEDVIRSAYEAFNARTSTPPWLWRVFAPDEDAPAIAFRSE